MRVQAQTQQGRPRMVLRGCLPCLLLIRGFVGGRLEVGGLKRGFCLGWRRIKGVVGLVCVCGGRNVLKVSVDA